MAALILLMAGLVACCSFCVAVVGEELKEPFLTRYQRSNDVKTANVGESSPLSKMYQYLQPPNQLGWDPSRIDSGDQSSLKKKREPEKDKNNIILTNNEDGQRKETNVRFVENRSKFLWVWNPLAQSNKVWNPQTQTQTKATSNIRKVDENSLQRATDIKSNEGNSTNMQGRNFVRKIDEGRLESNERKDGFFRGFLVLDPNGVSKFLLQTNPSDLLNSKTPQYFGNQNYLKEKDLGISGQDIYATVGEDGRGIVGIGYAEPSLMIKSPSLDQHTSEPFLVGGFWSKRQMGGVNVKPDDLASSFKLVKGSSCR